MSIPILFRIACTFVIMISGLIYLAKGPQRSSANLQQEVTASQAPDTQTAESFCIEVRGKRFHWSFTYPGPDGVLHTEDDQTVERLLRIPAGKNVTFHVTSDDYVYILGIPANENASGSVEKQREIAVPDLVHFMEYESASEGSYDLMVDPLCGFKPLHDPLMGKILVTDDYGYQDLLPPADETALAQ